MKAHLNLALACEKTDNPEEALAAYKKIVEMNPGDLKSQLKVKDLQKTVDELN
jgi:tetratricopeptide (TPR) repeat protein